MKKNNWIFRSLFVVGAVLAFVTILSNTAEANVLGVAIAVLRMLAWLGVFVIDVVVKKYEISDSEGMERWGLMLAIAGLAFSIANLFI